MTPRYQGTTIAAEATQFGPAGRAWRLELLPVGQRPQPDQDGTIAGYIVRVPGAHIMWDHWMMSVIHLRPIAGARPAVLTFKEATHEMVIMALNPEQPLPASLRVDHDFRIAHLTPIDVVEQFTAADDVVAETILELAVQWVVDGVFSPDQDYRRMWKQAIAKTAAHFADGTHRVARH